VKTKQVIIIRKDLKMRRGKEIAQACHASMAFLSKITASGNKLSPIQQEWFDNSYRKITLQVDSEAELDAIHEKAKAEGIESHLIIDNGFTEFHNIPTKTCIALGPDLDETLDCIVGHLKLY